jgi:hypothetical protein
MGLLSRVVQRRVPTIHVVFRRRHGSHALKPTRTVSPWWR